MDCSREAVLNCYNNPDRSLVIFLDDEELEGPDDPEYQLELEQMKLPLRIANLRMGTLVHVVHKIPEAYADYLIDNMSHTYRIADVEEERDFYGLETHVEALSTMVHHDALELLHSRLNIK